MDPPPSHRAARLGGREKTERPAAGLARRYLNTPEAGGGTRFPRIGGGLTVQARKGRALLWPSVLDSDPYARDDRTDHEAKPVRAGVKYAANYWLHMYNYRDKSEAGCEGIAYADNWY